MFTALQKCIDDAHMALSRRRVNTPRTSFIWHMKKDALAKERLCTLGMSMQRGNMHKRATILGSLEYTRFELVSKQLDDARVTILYG